MFLKDVASDSLVSYNDVLSKQTNSGDEPTSRLVVSADITLLGGLRMRLGMPLSDERSGNKKK